MAMVSMAWRRERSSEELLVRWRGGLGVDVEVGRPLGYSFEPMALRSALVRHGVTQYWTICVEFWEHLR